MPATYIYLWFDIEDYVTKATDDLPLKAFSILRKYKVPVTCKLVSEKLRELIKNGREDVISEISEYDVGYHSDTHSRHPTPYEYLAELDLLSGAREFMSREERGVSLIKEVFKRVPSCYGHPGPEWAPHVYPALNEMGIKVYLDETDIINLNDQPYWYCGVLNLNGAGRNSIYFDRTFEEPNGVEKLKSKFDMIYERLQKENGGAVSICFHLHTVLNSRFWDEVNFSGGKNREKEEYESPPLQPEEVTERAWRDFEEFIRYVTFHEGIRWITGSDAIEIYQHPIITLNRERLKEVLQHFLVSSRYFDGWFGQVSPAEWFHTVTVCLDEYAKTKMIPDKIILREPIGPTDSAKSMGSKRLLTEDFLGAAGGVRDFLDNKNIIPTSIKVGDYAELSPHDYMATAGDVMDLNLSGRKLPDQLSLRRGRPPQVENLNYTNFLKACRWTLLPNGFHAPKIFEQAELQAWTLKPAIPKAN